MDFSLSAVADEVISRAVPQPGERTIDIGCGTGATSLRLAEIVGPSGSLLGVDISADMLGLAKKRAAAAGFEHARFELADAQVHPFKHGNADLLASRFGVMFFDDPIAAFANMLSALRPGGVFELPRLSQGLCGGRQRGGCAGVSISFAAIGAGAAGAGGRFRCCLPRRCRAVSCGRRG